MSTDTAFVLGLLALVGPRFPDRLRAFMLTVVVVDDIVALIVIATVYTEALRVVPLLAAVAFFGAVLVESSLLLQTPRFAQGRSSGTRRVPPRLLVASGPSLAYGGESVKATSSR
jgi:ABC-type amino acid transport system permease subunit